VAASIIYVGDDDCHRVAVLKTAGFEVNDCTSFAQLHSALTAFRAADAVAIAESHGQLPQKAISLTRASSSIPLILFQSAESLYDRAEFDLVISPCADPRKWLTDVQALIERSYILRAQSQALHAQSASLRKDAAALVEKSRLERARSRTELGRNRQR
jgi:hypothetical protein